MEKEIKQDHNLVAYCGVYYGVSLAAGPRGTGASHLYSC